MIRTPFFYFEFVQIAKNFAEQLRFDQKRTI